MPEWNEETQKQVETASIGLGEAKEYMRDYGYPDANKYGFALSITVLMHFADVAQEGFAAALEEIERQAMELRGAANVIDTYLEPEQRKAPLHDKMFIALGVGDPDSLGERALKAEQRVKELEERETDLLAELGSYRSQLVNAYRSLLVNDALSSEGEEE